MTRFRDQSWKASTIRFALALGWLVGFVSALIIVTAARAL